jgi:hypothetical protein
MKAGLDEVKGNHRKNTRSQKFEQSSLKAMLVEKLQRRFDIEEKRKMRVNLYGSQPELKGKKVEIGNLKGKKFVRRRSRRNSQNSLSKKKNVFR